MTDGAVAAERRLWVAAALGAYAALVAFVPAAGVLLALAALLLAALVCGWLVVATDRWVAAFFAAALLLPPLPILLGDSGPHSCLLIAALGLLAGLARPRQWDIPPDALTGSFLAFFFVLLLGVPLAALYSGPGIAAATLARVLLFGISLYVFFYTAYGPGGRDFTRPLFWIAVASALFACIDFYYQFPAPAGFGPQYIWLDTGVYRRAQGIFYEASTLGNFCAFFLVLVAVCFAARRDRLPACRPALLAGGAVLAAALVFSYSRASILNLGVAVAVLVLRGRRPGKLPLAIVAALAAGAAASYFLFPAIVRLYWERLWSSAAYFFTYTEGIFSGRLASWRQLARFMLSHPPDIILGVGYKTLPYSGVAGSPIVADNMYLSLLVETGVVGLAVMLWFNFNILRAALRAARYRHPRASFFGSWIFCFWVGQMFQMLSGDLLTFWRVLPVYLWVLGMAVRFSRADPVP